MEQRKRTSKAIDGKKKLILMLDAVLLVGLVAAIVALIVTLTGRNKQAVTAMGTPASAQMSAESAQQGAPADVEQVAGAVVSAYADALQLGGGGLPESVDFASLSAQGVNAVAWLYCPDTAISYPVMQTLDNEYYMEHNELGKRDKSGAISLDCRNSVTLSEAQVMLYGNAMDDGTMFASLSSYRDAAYLAAHPCFYLITPEKVYRIDVFAANTASPAMANYPTWFESDAARATYLSDVKGKSFFSTELTIASNATLVSLVTNSDFEAGEDARFVVHGVLTEQ